MRIFAKWIMGSKNQKADFLSRQKISQFKRITADTKVNPHLDELPPELWPVSKLWVH